MMMRSILSLAMFAGLTACGFSQSAAAPQSAPPAAAQQAPADKAYKVKISNFTFDASVITVPVGATVTWVNDDDVPHTVVSEDTKTFRSKTLDTSDSFSFTFTMQGEFGYFCSLHPHMTGKIIVKAS